MICFVVNKIELDAIEEGLRALHQASFQHKGWSRLAEQAGTTLDRPGAAVLKTIVGCGKHKVTVQSVAQHLGIEAPSASRKVQQLEDAGLLIKEPDAQDQRARNLHITDAGRRELEKLHAAKRAQLAKVFSNWSTDERKHFANLLKKYSQELLQELNEENE